VAVCAAAAGLVWVVPAGAGRLPDEIRAGEQVRLLDVPYVPQSEALCGGAALAMVFRYWGKPGVLASDFAALVDPGGAGIRTDSLMAAVGARGWTARPLPGTPAAVVGHLARGRPVIALLGTGSGTHHYVVLVAWAHGWVIIHDPKVGPLRSMREGEFVTAWSGSGGWALLVLPPRGFGEQVAEGPAADPSSPAVPEACGGLVEAGILLARQGDTVEAELSFLAAQTLCPESPAPLRERAGLRFLAGDWAGASRLAGRALALDPGDAHTLRILAGSRFLAGDVEGALSAWNHLSEPRTDLTRIDGLTRIRYSAVAGQLSLPPGRLLTAQAFRQASRRLAELPAQSDFRLSLRPLPGGDAQVNVTLLERPALFDGPWDVGSAVVQAWTRREIALDVASLTGNGELWAAAWRWWEDRPRVSLTLTVPGAGGRPGIWRVDGFWERQTYAAPTITGPGGTTPSEVSREERRRTALSFSDWLGPDLRLEMGGALDEWVGRGAHFSLDGNVKTRWARDRLELGARGARWISLTGGASFGAGGLSLKWSSSGLETCDAWQGGLEISSASSQAPLALWSGAGTGYGRAPLLRAHPLLDGGVLQRRVFGRMLLNGMIERQMWGLHLGPLQFGWAVFLDGAKPWDTGRIGDVPWQMDGGTGLRVRGPGIKGQLRIDAARGFEDGSAAISIGWRVL
jgi:hypothetical protein